MANNSISPEILQFITDHIRSIEQLEILCLFAENRDRSWTVAEVFRYIQSTEKSVSECIRYFTTEGMLAGADAPRFRFQPKNRGLENLVVQLAKNYRERRVKIVEAIYNKPPAPVQDFAKAFRIRKE